MVETMLSNLRPAPGATHRRKRIGCGEGSGHGGSATRGTKGQGARSGDGRCVGFEGGQMSLLRRIPKRGFSRRALKEKYELVHVGDLARRFASGFEVSLDSLKEKNLVRGDFPVKVVSDGNLDFPLKVWAHSFTARAREKIEKAGGSCSILKRSMGDQ